MSDLFHDAIPDEYIARVFAVMALAPWHTFQLLTKRHSRMRSLLNNRDFRDEVWRAACDQAGDGDSALGYARILVEPGEPWAGPAVWPLPNVWQIGSAHVSTPVTNAHLVCSPLRDK